MVVQLVDSSGKGYVNVCFEGQKVKRSCGTSIYTRSIEKYPMETTSRVDKESHMITKHTTK